MEKLEKAIKGMKKAQDLFDTSELSLFLQTSNPSKFKMPKIRWFLLLDKNWDRILEDICTKFNKQYKYNIKLDITQRDLETTKWELLYPYH